MVEHKLLRRRGKGRVLGRSKVFYNQREDYNRKLAGRLQVSERSERAFWKTRIYN